MRAWFSNIRTDRARVLVTACGYLGVAIVSSVPGAFRPDLAGVSDKVEHILAFLVLGGLTVVAAPRTIAASRLIMAIVAYAAILEIGQIFIPSRVASLVDFGASSVGAVLGVTAALLIRWQPLRL